jgi:hypothetical protein
VPDHRDLPVATARDRRRKQSGDHRSITDPAAGAAGAAVAIGAQGLTATFTLTGRRVGRGCVSVTSADHNHARCTRTIALTVSYQLSEAADVTLVTERTATGRLVAGRCRPATRTNRTDRHCTLVTARATITHTSTTGTNHVIIHGQIRGVKLVAGRYTLLATPTAGQLAGTQRSTIFRIAP